MGISQADIDALLSSAGELADSAKQPPSPQPPSPLDPSPEAEPTSRPVRYSAELSRILRINVPVIVVLAERDLAVSTVLGLTTGSIIEFEIPADSALKLLVANVCVGSGHAVKVGENFGLRITSIGAVDDRIKALGPG